MKVKKELGDFATLVNVFGPNSSLVKEQRVSASWKGSIPEEILEELGTLSGWQRCEEQKSFSITMPAEDEPLELFDDEPASCLRNSNTTH